MAHCHQWTYHRSKWRNIHEVSFPPIILHSVIHWQNALDRDSWQLLGIFTEFLGSSHNTPDMFRVVIIDHQFICCRGNYPRFLLPHGNWILIQQSPVIEILTLMQQPQDLYILRHLWKALPLQIEENFIDLVLISNGTPSSIDQVIDPRQSEEIFKKLHLSS